MGFLRSCTSLVSVDLSVFTNVESIEDSFLEGCTLLEMVDLGAFEKVVRIKDDFLSVCTSLKTISGIEGLRNVKSVGRSFLGSCDSLAPIDTSVPGYEVLSDELKKEFERVGQVHKEDDEDTKILEFPW
eukprot:TRINITY_DN14495_c0_g1_i1.p1 TRINITY_DN14495_c0_g1~~TRINITY_DN14495_c0_g1_i1.p1  ORF type:complete len:138 (+),score=28.52 TRINITY_DN14495_c0_g1_i1:30-416(+)